MTPDGKGNAMTKTFTRVTTPDGRRILYPGTPEQAEAWVALQYFHETHPKFPELLAQLRGE